MSFHALLQGIFPTRGSKLPLMFPALAGEFFTTSATWEAPCTGGNGEMLSVFCCIWPGTVGKL